MGSPSVVAWSGARLRRLGAALLLVIGLLAMHGSVHHGADGAESAHQATAAVAAVAEPGASNSGSGGCGCTTTCEDMTAACRAVQPSGASLQGHVRAVRAARPIERDLSPGGAGAEPVPRHRSVGLALADLAVTRI
ncbi:hypothetical protein Sya03_60040 [Spirilliplanes yamanashiensis]|uniref:Uncharacterized protein n=1 Tax=Spirilliplanes yamanashiensis TaxID=42233 RepID=A0A8J3YF75_9ACTN|nr:hypothetical protein Sya03_60040 [Spirilliplanes yamanashiensis]